LYACSCRARVAEEDRPRHADAGLRDLPVGGGVASPLVVGYVDIGYDPDKTAVFSGINHPF
jgi:hypothetical protein